MKIVLWVVGIFIVLAMVLFYGYMYGLPYVAPYWCCRHPYLSKPTLTAVMRGSRWRDQNCGYLHSFINDCWDDYLPVVRAEMIRIVRSDPPDYDAYWRLSDMLRYCRIEEQTEMEILETPSGTMGQIRKTTLQPWWAKSTGTDQYGPWADLLIGEQTYRFRLVPTGKYRKTIRYFDQKKKQELKTVEKIECIENEYWLGETEVTGAQFDSIMKLKNDPPVSLVDDQPMEISWGWWTNQICPPLNAKYPNLGVTLPTEQQWEFACFAQGLCPPDQNLGEYCWYITNSDGKIHPVGKKRPNAWGFYDMQGNAEEWCLERYQAYWSVEDDGVSKQERDDFQKRFASAMPMRLLKGGSIYSEGKDCQAFSRDSRIEQYGSGGCRLCIPAK